MIVSGLSMMKPLLHTPSTKGDLLKSSVAARMSGNGIRTCNSRKSFAAAIEQILPANCQHAPEAGKERSRCECETEKCKRSPGHDKRLPSGYQATASHSIDPTQVIVVLRLLGCSCAS